MKYSFLKKLWEYEIFIGSARIFNRFKIIIINYKSVKSCSGFRKKIKKYLFKEPLDYLSN